MLLTPFHVRPSFKNIKWQVANYFSFPPLFVSLMPFKFLCSLVITPPQEIYLSSFHLWAHIRVTPLDGPLLALTHFCVFVFFKAFSFSFFSPSLIDDTHILALALIVPFAFKIFVTRLVYVSLVVQPCKCLAWALLACLLGLPSQLVFIILSTTLESQVSFFVLVPFHHPFVRGFGGGCSSC